MSNTVTLPEILAPINRMTIADQVAAIVKRFILVEDLVEGDQIPSGRQLAKSLGVSHIVVREAMSMLEGEGIIEKEHGRGSFVKTVDKEQLIAEMGPLELQLPDPGNLHETREAIERGAMYLVVENATDEDLEALEACIDAMRKAGEENASILGDHIEFHITLLRATHNEGLQGLSDVITTSLRVHNVWSDPRLLSGPDQEVNSVVGSHRAVLDAIRQRDGAKATAAMHRHLRAGGGSDGTRE